MGYFWAIHERKGVLEKLLVTLNKRIPIPPLMRSPSGSWNPRAFLTVFWHVPDLHGKMATPSRKGPYIPG